MRTWAKERSVQRGLSIPISWGTCYDIADLLADGPLVVWVTSSVAVRKQSESQIKCPEISAEGVLCLKSFVLNTMYHHKEIVAGAGIASVFPG